MKRSFTSGVKVIASRSRSIIPFHAAGSMRMGRICSSGKVRPWIPDAYAALAILQGELQHERRARDSLGAGGMRSRTIQKTSIVFLMLLSRLYYILGESHLVAENNPL